MFSWNNYPFFFWEGFVRSNAYKFCNITRRINTIFMFWYFDILLTVHLSIILATNQLNAQILVFVISLLYSSTCFEHYCAHHQDVKLYYTASGIVTLCRWPSGAQVDLCTGRPPADSNDTRCCIIQFDLLMISTTVLETCRGIK